MTWFPLRQDELSVLNKEYTDFKFSANGAWSQQEIYTWVLKNKNLLLKWK